MGVAARAGLVGLRKIKRLEHRIAQVAFYKHIHAPAIGLGLICFRFPVQIIRSRHADTRRQRWVHAWPGHLHVQLAAHEQHRIADDLTFQAAPLKAPITFPSLFRPMAGSFFRPAQSKALRERSASTSIKIRLQIKV